MANTYLSALPRVAALLLAVTLPVGGALVRACAVIRVSPAQLGACAGLGVVAAGSPGGKVVKCSTSAFFLKLMGSYIRAFEINISVVSVS